MKGIYFEEKGLMLLEHIGMTKSEFARRMGIQRQNVNVLFKTNNLETISRAADVLGVPFALLVSFVDEPDVFDFPLIDSDEQGNSWLEVRPEDVPPGDSVEDKRCRQEIIKQFYFYWKNRRFCNYLRIKRLFGLLGIWVTRWQPFLFQSSLLFCTIGITPDTQRYNFFMNEQKGGAFFIIAG